MSNAKYDNSAFKAYWKGLTPPQKRALADKVETSIGYLKQIAGGFSRPSLELARSIELASKRKVTRVSFRPEAYR